MIKDYGFLDIECAFCITHFGNLLAVGGYNGKFTLIDMNSRKILIKPVRTLISQINSIKFCILQNNNKLALIVSGNNFYTCKYKTDIFDVSNFLTHDNNKKY